MSLRIAIVAVAFLGTSLAIAPSPSEAQVSKSGSKYLFRINWAKGKTYKWKVATSFTTPGAAKAQSYNSNYSAAVKDVKNGIATVTFTTGAMPGQPAPAPTTVKIDNRGKIQGSAGGLEQVQAQMPAEPIAIGGKWSSTQKMGTGPAAGMTVATTYVFKGIKTVGGKQVAEISASTKTTGNPSMTGSGTGTMLVDMADGQLRSFTMSQNMSIKAGNKTTNIPIKVNISRT